MATDRTRQVEVDPRKPRLAWQGMDRREVAHAVPTQVVEVVRPGKAVAAAGALPLGATRQGRHADRATDTTGENVTQYNLSKLSA